MAISPTQTGTATEVLGGAVIYGGTLRQAGDRGRDSITTLVPGTRAYAVAEATNREAQALFNDRLRTGETFTREPQTHTFTSDGNELRRDDHLDRAARRLSPEPTAHLFRTRRPESELRIEEL